MSPEQSNERTVGEFLRLFSSGDVEQTMAMMTDDATWWVAGTMPISGTYDKAAFTQLLSGVLDTCTGPIRITPKHYTIQGDRVALEAESYTETRKRPLGRARSRSKISWPVAASARADEEPNALVRAFRDPAGRPPRKTPPRAAPVVVALRVRAHAVGPVLGGHDGRVGPAGFGRFRRRFRRGAAFVRASSGDGRVSYTRVQTSRTSPPRDGPPPASR